MRETWTLFYFLLIVTVYQFFINQLGSSCLLETNVDYLACIAISNLVLLF